MALTKVQKTGITDNAIDADKIEDGTIVAADIAPGTITNDKLAGSIANDKLANSSITVNGSSVSLGGSVSAGKVSWQSVKTADFNAVAGEGYFIDTTSSAITATLPASPSAGDTIAFKDYAGTFATNNLTIARNGNNIQGVANDSLLSTNRASVVLVYIDGTKGWLYTNESNVADLEKIVYVSATGGTIATSGDYKIHTFTGDGCFVVSTGNQGTGTAVDYLVLAGGGGGGQEVAGGGGAGGFRESKQSGAPWTASPLATPTGLTVTATTYPVTVGGGGSAGGPTGVGNGSNSVFSTITSAGGGAGGAGSPITIAQAGGSGGGGRGNYPLCYGAGNTPPVSPPQGQNGGAGYGPSPNSGYSGGGGGGAGVVGDPASLHPLNGGQGGDGGSGANSSISGSPVAYAAGGGGGSYAGGGSPGSWPGGLGGNPGAGNGGAWDNCYGTTPAKHATNASGVNRGMGGGGGGSFGGDGGSGSKGVVILRYKFQ